MVKTNTTYMAKPADLRKNYYIIDAKDKIVGRVATKAAHILRGKHKASFTPNIDCSDFVVVINAEKVKVTGKKMTDKIYQRYTGYPSGKRVVIFQDMLKNHPTEILRLAVHGMLPRGPIGNRIRTKLRIYAGDKHPHGAQKLVSLSV
jgi:large subunit ribosomal protein L13